MVNTRSEATCKAVIQLCFCIASIAATASTKALCSKGLHGTSVRTPCSFEEKHIEVNAASQSPVWDAHVQLRVVVPLESILISASTGVEIPINESSVAHICRLVRVAFRFHEVLPTIVRIGLARPVGAVLPIPPLAVVKCCDALLFGPHPVIMSFTIIVPVVTLARVVQVPTSPEVP